VRPSRRASVVRQPPWDPTEKGLYVDYPHGSYTVFGKVVSGMEHVDQIKQGDRMTRVTVEDA
jgi:cyclophilin family peptidyl-prolyl cis-trans isomerase